jgi:hypothetical protein
MEFPLLILIIYRWRIKMENTNNKRQTNNTPNIEREKEIIIELYKKGHGHVDISRCIERERKIFKVQGTDAEIGSCIKMVEDTILNYYKRSE